MPMPPLDPAPQPRRYNTDLNSIVSCEALSKVDWYSRPPHKPQLHYYYSDSDGDGKPTSEADDELEGAHSKEAASVRQHPGGEYAAAQLRMEKLKGLQHGYREASADQRPHSRAPFPSQSVYDKPPRAISSPGRDAKRLESVPNPHTYPGSIPPASGNLLSHSGIFLPHYMSHNSTSHGHHKGLTCGKTVTLIPKGTVKGAQSFNNTHEPSSPKVTCLGRVKIKHKLNKELRKLADMQPTTLPSEKSEQYNKKGVHRDVTAMSKGAIEVAVAGRVADLCLAPSIAELKRSKHGRISNLDANTNLDPASDSETKVTKGIRRTLKEAKSHMKLHRVKKSHPPMDSMASDHLSSHVESTIDLGRFPSIGTVQGQESRWPNASAALSIGEHGSLGTGFVPQVPPSNSLLLMRNSKSKAISATLASSSLTRTKADDSHENKVVGNGEFDVNRQAYLSFFEGNSCKHSSSSFLEVKLGELEAANSVADRQDAQGAILAELNVERLCAVAAKECKSLHGKQNAMSHCQGSLSKANGEVRLWQRRCIMKPSELNVGVPIALQVNEPSTR